jgi:hypothetical protein
VSVSALIDGMYRAAGLDVHTDTPVEILHTKQIGEDKYAWHETNKDWTAKQEALFATRLQSLSIRGLSVPVIRAHYMVKYKNNLIGKHFKTLQQLVVFSLDNQLCTKWVFELWKASGRFGALLWYFDIENMEPYLVSQLPICEDYLQKRWQAELQILIDNVLDCWAKIDPTRIIVKAKLHILQHLVEDIRRFGPAILFSTEVFECFNAVFRLCSVLSNHQAPSRDIAHQFSDMERFKHQASGGFWKDSDGTFVCAGPAVRQYFENTQLRRRLGWADPKVHELGVLCVLLRARSIA